MDCPKDKEDYILCVSPANCRYAEEDEADSSTDDDEDDDDQSALSDESRHGEVPHATDNLDNVAEDDVEKEQKEEGAEEHRQEAIREPEGELPSRSEGTEVATAEVEPMEKQKPEEGASISAGGVGEEDEAKEGEEEGGDEPESAHKPDHRLQLVVENPHCSLCDEPVRKAWYVPSSRVDLEVSRAR